MNDKNHALLVAILTTVVTTLVLGGVYLFVKKEPPETQTTTEKAVQSVLESGSTVLVSKNDRPWKCSPNGDPCENILVTTEIDLTGAGTDNQLTGRFYIRAYNGADYRSSPKIGELQITQNYNPFNGDGGTPYQKDTEEILTIRASENSSVVDELRFKKYFYLEFMESVPGWSTPGYVLRLSNIGKSSGFNGRLVDFYSSNGKIEISAPQ